MIFRTKYHIARKTNSVCIFSHASSQPGHTIHCSPNYKKRVIWADTDIRLIVKIPAQSATWDDNDKHLIVKSMHKV